jgi:hypothetical protein
VQHGVLWWSKEKMTKYDGKSYVPSREISGKEPPAGDGSALDALIDFYRSFNASDLNALAGNWADGEAPSMDNPIGGIRRRWPAIREGYAKLFSGPAIVRVAFHDFVVQGNNDFHLFVGREKGYCETPAVRLRQELNRWPVLNRSCGRSSHQCPKPTPF